jgi:hypothetical protein
LIQFASNGAATGRLSSGPPVTDLPTGCKLGLEGIASKRLSAPYRSGPSKDWLKVKNPDSPAMIRAREADW